MSQQDKSQISSFKIDDVEVSPTRNRISIGAAVHALRPQPMDILVYLAHRTGNVVGPDELMNAVWNGRVVTLGSVYNAIAELRSALSQSATVTIETIPKRGYRLTGNVDWSGAGPTGESVIGNGRWRPVRIASYGAAVLVPALLIAVLLERETPDQSGTGEPARESIDGELARPGSSSSSRRARDSYDDGLYYLGTLDPMRDDFEQVAALAIQKFEEAIAADPDWALPHSELGGVLHRTRHIGEADSRLQRAEDEVREALRLDPMLGKAYGSLAYILAVRGAYGESAALYDKAISLQVDDAHWGKAILLRSIGQHDDAIREFELAVRQHPAALVLRFQLFETYYCAGRYADAVDGLEEFFPANGEPYLAILKANSYARLGETDKALTMADRIAEEVGDSGPVATVLALTGEDDRARAALDQSRLTEAPFVAVDMAPAAVILGLREQAIGMLERAASAVEDDVSLRYDWLWRFQCPPEIQGLRGHPRFDALVAQLGLGSVTPALREH